MLIIGVIIGAVSLNLMQRKESGSSVTTRLNLLRNRMLYTQQQAIILNKTFGLAFSEKGYLFMVFDATPAPGWQTLSDRALVEQVWPKNSTLQFNFKDRTTELLGASYPTTPQIIFSPSGEITPFVLQVNNQYVISSTEANEILIKQK
jgi:hypothetical protein